MIHILEARASKLKSHTVMSARCDWVSFHTINGRFESKVSLLSTLELLSICRALAIIQE